MTYLAALAATIVIEVPLVVVLRTLLLDAAAVPRPHVALAGLVANLLSHPLAFLVVWPLVDRRGAALVPIEIAIVAVEAVVLSRGLRLPWWPCLLTSGAVNATSVVLGALVFRAT